MTKEAFVGGVGWMGVSKIITQSGTWIATIIIARLLTPADYGLVGMSGLLVGMITLIGDFGLNSSIIQKMTVSHKEISALFWQYIFIGFFLSFLIFVLAPFGCRFWKEPQLLNLIRLSAVAFFLSTLGQIPSALLQKNLKFREYGIILSLSAISGSVVSILLAYHGMGPYSLILGSLAVVVVNLLLTFRYQPFWPQFIFVTSETKKHLKFGATITLERYLWWYYSNCDFWLASKFLGKNLYGSYSMAFQLASLPAEKITSIINPVVFPVFSKISDDKERNELFFTVVRYMAYISFPIFVVFFWTADDLINVVLGEKWRGSIVVFKVFVLIFPLRCLASLTSPFLNSMRRADIGVKNMATGSVIATIVFAFGVQYGIVGLAYAWLFYYPIFFLFCLFNVAQVANFPMIGYIANLYRIMINMIFVSSSICLFQLLFDKYIGSNQSYFWPQVARLGGTAMIGAISFLMFLLLFDRDIVKSVINFFNKREIVA